ncbi:hypothetical protein KPH14_008932 [Odynerus spinipes]|uniref:Amino acid transporter transmembrane domain-containing protein n=1 Tax=Odynerus spinipes TaxID=1348599 RepID=A0AAD9RN73_9HYME|nr:hypothetical protein KPH14_008932 [Odynerus spinipes]
MYDEIVEATLKNADVRVPWIFIELATFFTNALLIFYHLGVSSVYVDFIGDVMREIMKLEETNHPAAYTMLFFPLFMLLNLTKDLHDMISKSIAGNILILNVIIVSLVCAFNSNTSDSWTMLRNDIFLYPRFIGIVFYSLSSPGLVLAIEHSTSNSYNYTKFHKALDQGMILITCLHLVVGIVGYLKWGSNVSENFIRDIQKEAEGYALIAFIMQALAIYLTYGLQCYVPISIFLKQYGMPAMKYGTCKGTLYLWDLIVRFAVTLVSSGILPMLIPKLRLRVALLGVTCNFILTLLLPLVLHMLLFINDLGETVIRNRKVIVGILSIVLACVLALCCFITELSLIFKKI